MILKLKQNIAQKEIEILIRYAQMDEELKSLIRMLNSSEARIKCREADSEKMISAAEIYYIESVDKKTFVYGKETVYGTDFRLYQLLDGLERYGFLQISKSCILNIHYLESIKTLPNSRMEATLKNGEHLLVNRKYLADIRRALEAEL